MASDDERGGRFIVSPGLFFRERSGGRQNGRKWLVIGGEDVVHRKKGKIRMEQ
jgi:hypothetical protein